MASNDYHDENNGLDETTAGDGRNAPHEVITPGEVTRSIEPEDSVAPGGSEESVESATGLPQGVGEPATVSQPEEQGELSGLDEAEIIVSRSENEEHGRAGPTDPPLPRFDEETLWRTEDVDLYPEGFPQAAAMVNADPNFAIFRCFGRLRNRVLLQIQAELMGLENKLDQYDRRVDANAYAKGKLYQSGFPSEAEWPDEAEELHEKHSRCLHDIKAKLKEFDEQLIRYSNIRTMAPPSRHARSNISRWFYQTKPLVEDQNEHLTYIEDLVTLGKGEEESWTEGAIANALERRPLQIFMRFFVSPEQRKKARGNGSSFSDQIHYKCPKRLKAAADTSMVTLVSMLALLPFYYLFSLDARVITLFLLSNFASTQLLSFFTPATKYQLFMLASSQSSLLALAALISRIPSVTACESSRG